MDKNIIELVNNLPKCSLEYCNNIATYRWYNGVIECDKHAQEFGRDWKNCLIEGDLKELPYTIALRKVLISINKALSKERLKNDFSR